MLAQMGTLNFDRYHAAMGDASYKDATSVHGKPLSEMLATFYVTQRKLPFAPVLGHERLIRLLVDSQIDRPRLRFLEQDRGGLQRFAKAIEDIQFAGNIRAVPHHTARAASSVRKAPVRHSDDSPIRSARVRDSTRLFALG